MSECVEWQFQDQSGQMVAFDPQGNLILEDSLVTKEMVKVKINGETYHANAEWRKACSFSSQEEVELRRVDKKGQFIKVQTETVGPSDPVHRSSSLFPHSGSASMLDRHGRQPCPAGPSGLQL